MLIIINRSFNFMSWSQKNRIVLTNPFLYVLFLVPIAWWVWSLLYIIQVPRYFYFAVFSICLLSIYRTCKKSETYNYLCNILTYKFKPNLLLRGKTKCETGWWHLKFLICWLFDMDVYFIILNILPYIKQSF